MSAADESPAARHESPAGRDLDQREGRPAATDSIEMTSSYTIRGGRVGRERLRMLSGVFGVTTGLLLDRVGIAPDARCLDVGCGGGDVTAMLAARAPHGHVVGTDRDAIKIDIARREAAKRVELRVEELTDTVDRGDTYDVVYARFLLSHLSDAGRWVTALAELVEPGGALVLEDVRISGAFCSPSSAAFERYLEIYCQTVRANGGDPEVGPHLPRYLHEAGRVDVGIEVVQPAALNGDAKRIQVTTLAAIKDAAIEARVADSGEIDRLTDELTEFVERPDTVATAAQIIQTWGRRAIDPVVNG